MNTKRLAALLGLMCLFVLPTLACETPTPVAPTPTAANFPNLGGRQVTVVVDNAYAPFGYIDPVTGQATGWDYEVVQELGRRLNFQPAFVSTPWENLFNAIAANQFDMAGEGITITEERAKIVGFSIGYMQTAQRLLVLRDDNRYANIQAFSSDPTAKIGTQPNTTNYDTAISAVGAARVVGYDQYSTAVRGLIAGEVQGVIIDETAGQGYTGADADKVKIVGEPISSDTLGFIFAKNSPLIEPINIALKTMMDDGTLDRINAKYFGPTFRAPDSLNP